MNKKTEIRDIHLEALKNRLKDVVSTKPIEVYLEEAYWYGQQAGYLKRSREIQSALSTLGLTDVAIYEEGFNDGY